MVKSTLRTATVAVLLIFVSLCSWGQGTESFTNIPTGSSGSYSNRSWTGDNGATWGATDARTDQTITGKAICIRNGALTFGLTTAQQSAGIGDLTINAKAPFGNPPDIGTLELVVNGTSISTKTTTGSTISSVVSYTWSGINVASLTSIVINQTTSGKRIAIDDVVWTAYSGGASPSLTVGTLDNQFGNVCVGATAGPQQFTVSGSNLDGSAVSVGTLSSFTYSLTSGGTYTSTLGLPYTAPTLGSTTVYVKFTPAAATSYNGNITVSGGGASATNCAVTSATGINSTVAVTTVTVSSVNTTSANSGGNSVSTTCGATITAKGVVWGTAANPTVPSVNSTNDGSGTANYTSSVTGLTANTVYHYRAYITNSSSVTGYGNDLTFTTISLPPTSPAASSPTANGFTASWSAPTGQGAASYTYTVEVYTNSAFTGAPVTTVSSIASTSTTITGLSPSTTYYYRVRVANAGGNSSYAGYTTGITTLAGPLWSNDITGTSITASPYTTGDSKDANISVSGISRGSGVSAAGANNRYNANGWDANTLYANDYFEFTLTPNSGYKIDFTNFVYSGQASGSGPTSFAFRSSADGYTANIGSPTATGTTISLSGAAYQTITAAITFRFYGWNASGGSGTFSINDFEFNGTVSPFACAAPTTQASAITFSNVLTSSMDIGWTNGDGSNRVVYINSTNSFTAPTDGGTLPSANTTWANSGQQLVYNSNGSSVSVTGLSASTTYYFRVYEYNCTGSSSKFITSTATNNPNSQATTAPTSTASVIQAVSGSEATTISSLENGTITNNTQGAQVWQFKLFDGNGSADDGDALPTIYKQWTIRAAAGNTVPNWTTVVDNVKFFDGSSSTPISGSFIVGNSTISFTPTSGLSVADGAGSFKQISMRLSIDNPMAAGSDGKRLVFKLEDADVTVDNSTVSSQLGSFAPTSSSSKNEIDVIATLQFINAPASVPVGSNFTITVSAIDANGNIDQNQTPAITLAKSSGAGTLTGGATHNLVAGTYTFSGLSYNQVGTFQISASGGGFSAVYATINSTNDPYQLFDDFNRANNNTVGIPSSGGSTAWTETETGDGSRLRIDNGTLVLSNCNVSPASGGNGVEQAQFNGTGKYATTFANASGELVWLFNMKSTRNTPSGFSNSTNTYGGAVVLGSSKSDFGDAAANGYAVIIGNQGTPDPVKLIHFTNGLNDNSHISDIVASNYTGETGYLSVKVVFNPCNSQWSLYVRNDGSSFAAPNVGSLGSAFTATNSTYTASSLPYFGALWQHNNSCSETLTIDNLYIPNAAALSGTAKLWTGNIDNDWSKTGNWCKGSVPTSTDDATIPNVTNSPVIGGSAAVKDISLAGGATLTVANGGSLTLNGTFANSGAVTIQDGGNFLQGNSSSYGGSGTFTVEKSITNIANGYRDVSSPVATTVADLADDFTVFGQNGVNCWYSYSPYPNVQVYDEAANNALSTPTGNYFTGWLSRTGNSNTLSPMQGFAIRTYAGAPFTLDFTGTPHNDTLNRAITNTPSASTSQDGWNFVGNPYPSNIDWVTAAALNSSSIDGNYYVFNTTGEYTGNWGTCNASGVASGLNGISATIASGQGFFVKTSAGGTFTLNNTVRTATAANFYKAGVQSNEVRLLLSGQGNSDEIVAYTDANASQNEDKGLDAVKIPAGSTVYMGYVSQGKDYAINVLDEITENTELPLIMRVSENGNYSLTANALNLTDLTAYLKDKTTGTLTNLETGNIVLQLNANENYNNYSIVFAAKVVSGINESAENAVSIYSNKNQVTVLRNKNTPATITIYNMMGQQLTEETTTSRKTTIELNGSQAWYAIVKVKEEGINKVSKVFISNK